VASELISKTAQFVHAPDSCQRLPELALLAVAILSYGAISLSLPPSSGAAAPFRTISRVRQDFARVMMCRIIVPMVCELVFANSD
jgi:hypothetical protein